MEAPSAKEPRGKSVVSGGGRRFHHGVVTPWCLTKHRDKNLYPQVRFDNGCGLRWYGCGKPPAGVPVLHPNDSIG